MLLSVLQVHAGEITRTVDPPAGGCSGPSNFSAENTCAYRNTGCFPLPLTLYDNESANWELVGIPFLLRDGVALDDLRVVANNVCADINSGCTMTEANARQLISDIVYQYNYRTESYDSLTVGSTLNGWNAYWIRVFSQAGALNPVLQVPEFRTAELVIGEERPVVLPDVTYPFGHIEEMITITNEGDSMATRIMVDPLSAPFSLLQDTLCGSNYSVLAAGAPCDLNVRFSGAFSPGFYVDELSVIYNNLHQAPWDFSSNVLQGTIVNQQ